jgi:zinc D-Ala-D-Ala carboxypeptidase
VDIPVTDPVRTFRHFRDVPQNLWRWPNFSPAEIACRGTGQLKLHPAALDKLQALRDRLGKPLIIRSAYRSPEHNGVLAEPRAQGTWGHGLRYRHVKP